MDLLEFTGIYLIFTWIYLNGFTLAHLVSLGFTWCHLVLLGFTWVNLGWYGRLGDKDTRYIDRDIFPIYRDPSDLILGYVLIWSSLIFSKCEASLPPPPHYGLPSYANWNANFVTNALWGNLSTVNVRPWCGHHTCSVHRWIGNWILPQFNPWMSSLALLEAEIPSLLYVTGNNKRCFYGGDSGCCCFCFM